MPDPLPIQAKRSVKLQCDVDRALAARVDAIAKQYAASRAAVIRAAVEQSRRWALSLSPQAGTDLLAGASSVLRRTLLMSGRRFPQAPPSRLSS